MIISWYRMSSSDMKKFFRDLSWNHRYKQMINKLKAVMFKVRPAGQNGCLEHCLIFSLNPIMVLSISSYGKLSIISHLVGSHIKHNNTGRVFYVCMSQDSNDIPSVFHYCVYNLFQNKRYYIYSWEVWDELLIFIIGPWIKNLGHPLV